MGLNRELNIVYGYRFDGIPITTYIDKLYERDDVKTQCEMLDSISTPDENNFVVCTDGMLCKYEYVGLLCYSHNCEENSSISYDSDEIKKLRLEKVAVINTDLSVGDKVEVLEGALFGFVGEIVGIDTEANKCRVMVEMFGRETPVDLTLEQIKKIN